MLWLLAVSPICRTALTAIGVPKGEVIKFETALKGAKYVLMVHGNAEEVAKARSVLAGTEALEKA